MFPLAIRPWHGCCGYYGRLALRVSITFRLCDVCKTRVRPGVGAAVTKPAMVKGQGDAPSAESRLCNGLELGNCSQLHRELSEMLPVAVELRLLVW